MKSIILKNKSGHRPPVSNIAAPKLAVTTVGYINLFSRRKAQVETVKKTICKGLKVTCTQVRVFKTKTARKLANLHLVATFKKVATRMNTMFKQAFVQAGIFESRIRMAKQSLQDAKKKLLSTQEYFALHVELAKACLHMRTFKFSLLPSVKSLLF